MNIMLYEYRTMRERTPAHAQNNGVNGQTHAKTDISMWAGDEKLTFAE